jgi:hypothetical protein
MSEKATDNLAEISPTEEDLKITHLVVAVHGIGNQFRYSTVQAVASRFMTLCGRQITLPLGAFHPVKIIRKPDSPELGAYLFEPPKNSKFNFSGFGFAEVFWADIPERAAASNNTTEESKAWARTIVGRVRAIDETNKLALPNLIDYQKMSAVLEEMIDSIRVMENLLFIAKKAGIFDFKLGQLLTDFLGDVQIVADFKDYGGDVFKRFARTLMRLNRRLINLQEIYIAAHSEGTVVALKGLLTALAAPKDQDNEWVEKVKGYMTIGSPLNKHIVLWPDLWKELKPHQSRTRDTPIFWRNYYDFGDPVGFDLEITRNWLADNHWTPGKSSGSSGMISFRPEDDCGFTRYPFPGEAHNDYWEDDVVFEHFIQEVIIGKGKITAPKPLTLRWPAFVSNVVPYLLCLALISGGTYAFYKTFTSVFHIKYQLCEMARNVAGITCLLAGITLLGRLPRLVKAPRSLVIGCLAFVIGAAAYSILALPSTRMHLGSAFLPSKFGLVVAGFVVGAGAAAFSKWKPQWGMSPLIGLGAIAALLILKKQMQATPPGIDLALWPLLLANAAFLYLWWLSALLFDLVFIWHEYIRSTHRTNKTLEALRVQTDSELTN